MKICHIFVSLAFAVFLFAPALKVRFRWDDLFVYYIAFGIFAIAAVVGNALRINQTVPRLAAMSAFLLLAAGPYYAFLLAGAVDTDLMITVCLNLLAGMLVVMYPWDEDSMDYLLMAFVVLGSVISINTMIYYGTDDALAEIFESQDPGEATTAYLTPSFAMGIGVIASTYFMVKNFSVVTVPLFCLNWLGIALGRGRGAFLVCIIVTVVYLLAAMNSKISGFNRAKKSIVFVLMLVMIPVVFHQLMKISRMRVGLERILFSPEEEADEGGRGSAFAQGIDQFMDSPVFGNGLGAYMDNSFDNPHNLLIAWGVDSGLIGLTFLGLFFLCIFLMFRRSVRLSTNRNINLAYVMIALCTFMFLNYMKSFDPSIKREMYLMAALPIAAYVVITGSRARSSYRRRRRRVRVRRPV